MKNSQYRIEQVTANGAIPTDTNTTTNNTTATTTNTTATTSPTDSQTTVDNTDGSKDTTTTDTPTNTNKPIIVLMDKPNSDANKKGMTNPSEVVYFGVMGAIIIALLAVAYNSVKTASIGKVK